MRYYKIEIFSDAAYSKSVATFSTLDSTSNHKRGALMVELDIPRFAMATPKGAAYVNVWGLSVKDIMQAENFNGMFCRVSGGMSKGLPLANAAQAGVLCQGTIQQAFGNWQGINQYMTLMINAISGSVDSPTNLILKWTVGSTLATALRNCLTIAYPDYSLNMSISSSLICNYDQLCHYPNLRLLGKFCNDISKTIVTKSNYQGVQIVDTGKKVFNIYDGTTSGTEIAIKFQDLIGQPTWIEPLKINVRLVLRADIITGDIITLPAGSLAKINASSYSQYRQASVFQGKFFVTDVRIMGNSRQPDGDSWVTSIEATAKYE
jgi:hypothetical protein